MPSFNERGQSGRDLVIIDWGCGGHSRMYLEKIVSALVPVCDRIVVLSEYEQELKCFIDSRLSDEKTVQVGSISFANWKTRFLPPRLCSRVGAFVSGLQTRRKIRKQFGSSRNARIFFPRIAEWESIYHRWFCAGLGIPWSGLIINFKGLRVEGADMSILRNFNERKCLGVLTLDENRTEWLSERVSGKIVGFLADVSETDWDPASALASEIRERARGRKVILLIGLLSPKKGVINFVKMALETEDENLFFVLAGELNADSFNQEEQRLLFEKFVRRDHCFLHGDALVSENEYNAVFRLASVVCIAYRNFSASSNTLTKAAFFEIPVVVGRGFLLEERVTEYGLGEVVDEHDPLAILAAVRRLAEGGLEKKTSDWERFQKEFSNDAFTHQLRSFITSVFSKNR
ncbi:glycosyltransferase [Puniceicoccus vermicola]|uniref:Glycosyltransferase n=1 Tax=Puniceicoccus vermicola TaxID=388746 RepID=A0A7X1E3K9_9BACT|nr:glycosyltransferase [Puniceicoccus vermicola]MBC2601083.1 glycosyltransferase [Puniceicoccus vermicola]